MIIARYRLTASLTIALLAFALTGCAVLFNPNPQHLPVASDPEGAEVRVDGTILGVTPITLEPDSRKSLRGVGGAAGAGAPPRA